jgi:enoyl-CoA hydratase/carnithine racemase
MSIKTATLNGVATIEIARPEKKNAITQAMYRAMAEAVDAAVADPAVRALMGCDKPVIAAVTGAAIGIGTTLLLHCDFVYVSDEARLAMPFVSLGLVPEFGSSLIVPQLIGNVRAAEKLLLGDPFSAADAVEAGIANAVLPAAEVVNHARRIAERFNALPPGAVRETKKLMRRARQAQTLETIGVEGGVFAERLRSPEAQEAFSAFFQKRKPDFSKF